jgi:thymidylate synthase ThyX
MKIIEQYFEVYPGDLEAPIMQRLEVIARTCYKSEDKTGEGTADKLVSKLIERGHEAMLEHAIISAKLVTDRGVTHEVVRHRIAAYAQESTRYVGYADKLVPNDKMEESDVIDLYESGLSMKKISKLSKDKYTEWQVYKILDSNDIERRGLGSKGIIHDDFFDKINTREKAYLLGFIQADGNLHKDSFQISITQKNGWFIERMLKDFIKPSTHGSKDGDCKQYSFTSERLYKSLVDKGIVPNKTYDMTPDNALDLWNSVPVSFKPHFLRGLMDGDGSLRFFKQSNPGETDSCNITWNANRHLIECIRNWLMVVFAYDACINKVSGTKDLWRISVTNPEVGEKLCVLMYDNFVFPYGHPEKTGRAFERIKFRYTFAQWGNPKFQVIKPVFWELGKELWMWGEAMDRSEETYSSMMAMGASPQEARTVLPNSLKTEIWCTYNIREFRHFFNLRCSPAAHPQMKDIACKILSVFNEKLPILFGDIYDKYRGVK